MRTSAGPVARCSATRSCSSTDGKLAPGPRRRHQPDRHQGGRHPRRLPAGRRVVPRPRSSSRRGSTTARTTRPTSRRWGTSWAQMVEKRTGLHIDGAIAIDPFAIAGALRGQGDDRRAELPDRRSTRATWWPSPSTTSTTCIRVRADQAPAPAHQERVLGAGAPEELRRDGRRARRLGSRAPRADVDGRPGAAGPGPSSSAGTAACTRAAVTSRRWPTRSASAASRTSGRSRPSRTGPTCSPRARCARTTPSA